MITITAKDKTTFENEIWKADLFKTKTKKKKIKIFDFYGVIHFYEFLINEKGIIFFYSNKKLIGKLNLKTSVSNGKIIGEE